MKLTRRVLLGSLAVTAFEARAADEFALGRPHTDFIQAQVTASHVIAPTGSQPGVDGATLSYDAKGTKAVSVVFRYPDNWSMERTHYVNSDQEFYVLAGELSIDDQRYKVGDYAYLPAGLVHKHMATANGTVLLNFYEGEHLAKFEPPPADMYKPKKLVKHLSTHTMHWQSGTHDDVAAWGRSAKRKLLRTDRDTGETTWLLKVDADDKNAKRRVVTHTAVEEVFVLEGQISTLHGVMKPGAYAWRVPGTPLGPFGTTTGFTALFRSKGGAPHDQWSSDTQPVVWDAAYNPQIPDAEKQWAFGSYDPKRNF